MITERLIKFQGCLLLLTNEEDNQKAYSFYRNLVFIECVDDSCVATFEDSEFVDFTAQEKLFLDMVSSPKL